jgi:hypothetical protein
MAYSTGVKSYYHPDAGICTRGGRSVVGWCLDNPCGESITGSFCSRSHFQCGAIVPADVCVDTVRRLYVWYYPVFSMVHPGCLGASCCVMLSRFGAIELVSIQEGLWWPMYGWCTGVCYLVVFKCMFYLVLIFALSLLTVHYLFALCGEYW